MLTLRAWPLCVWCQRQGICKASQVADHVRQHNGDHDRFYDPAGLIGICASCHTLKSGWERFPGHEAQLAEYWRYCDGLRATQGGGRA